MATHVGCDICNKSITRRMRAIKRISCKCIHLSPDSFCHFFTNPICNTAWCIVFIYSSLKRFPIAMDKDLMFMLHNRFFLLTHGPSHFIGPTPRKPGQFLYDADDLLLKHNNTVGHTEQFTKGLMVVVYSTLVPHTLNIVWD